MSILTREQILAQAKKSRQIEKVPVPEWGGEVCIRELIGTERDKFEATLGTWKGSKAVPNLENVRGKILAWTIVDESGSPLFSPDNGDVEILGSLSARSIQGLFVVAQKLSGFSDSDITEMVETLGNVRSAGSGSV